MVFFCIHWITKLKIVLHKTLIIAYFGNIITRVVRNIVTYGIIFVFIELPICHCCSKRHDRKITNININDNILVTNRESLKLFSSGLSHEKWRRYCLAIKYKSYSKLQASGLLLREHKSGCLGNPNFKGYVGRHPLWFQITFLTWGLQRVTWCG